MNVVNGGSIHRSATTVPTVTAAHNAHASNRPRRKLRTNPRRRVAMPLWIAVSLPRAVNRLAQPAFGVMRFALVTTTGSTGTSS
jgi:hypothetical protein